MIQLSSSVGLKNENVCSPLSCPDTVILSLSMQIEAQSMHTSKSASHVTQTQYVSKPRKPAANILEHKSQENKFGRVEERSYDSLSQTSTSKTFSWNLTILGLALKSSALLILFSISGFIVSSAHFFSVLLLFPFLKSIRKVYKLSPSYLTSQGLQF